jgi:hypothetical protein
VAGLLKPRTAAAAAGRHQPFKKLLDAHRHF